MTDHPAADHPAADHPAPDHPVAGIDHAYLLVEDLEAAAGQWRRMGFTLSPRGLHSASMGTGNYTMMFPHDYLELLGVVAEVEGNADQRARLAGQGQGLHAIACRVPGSAHEAAAALRARGIRTSDAREFSRPVDLPGGGKGEAAFAVFAFDPAEVPQGTVFACGHKTPDMVWIPELLQHPNGARGLAHFTAVAAGPEAVARGFARLYAAGAATPDGDGWRVATGTDSAAIRVVTADGAARLWPGVDLGSLPRDAFAGVAVRVSDLDAATRLLTAAGLDPVALPGGGVAIAPAHTAGAVVEFVAG